MSKRFDDAVAWFLAHKAVLGGFALGLSTVLIGAGSMYGWTWATTAGGILTLIGSAMVGAGAAKSDQFYWERDEVIETKVDRRAPRSGATIPPVDLAKLEAKVNPPPPPPYKEVP